MAYSLDYLENILLKNLKLNSNNENNEMCYLRCADKEKLNVLYLQKDHEIIFGRRGTGKTTLLRAFTYYINTIINSQDNIPTCFAIYINMEDIVPDTFEINAENYGAYIIETYRKFLIKIYDSIYLLWEILCETSYYYNNYYSDEELSNLTNSLIALENAINDGCDTSINKTYRQSSSITSENIQGKNKGVTLGFSFREWKELLANLSIGKNHKSTKTSKESITLTSEYSYTLDTSIIRKIINRIVTELKIDCLFVCIDEFTFVDKGLEESIQPNIAQMIKDTFFRNKHISVKITSLWSRNEMQSRNVNSIKRIGLEVGEDINRGIDLDTIFKNNDYAISFFESLVANVICLDSNDKNRFEEDFKRSPQQFTNYLLNQLFGQDAFDLLVCASQGIPRVFCDILRSAIQSRKQVGSGKITSQMIFDSTIKHFRQGTRKKIDNSDPLVIQIDDYVSYTKRRIIVVPIKNYDSFKTKINNLVDKNYLHQFPSETLPRKMRNKYKVFLVNYGNYLESLGIKFYRQLKNQDLSIFPEIPDHIIKYPDNYCFLFK